MRLSGAIPLDSRIKSQTYLLRAGPDHIVWSDGPLYVALWGEVNPYLMLPNSADKVNAALD